MLIKELNLTNFRNYEEEKILFKENINVFYGDNAQGKTNIIEAIFISSFGKSYRTKKEKEIIQDNKDFSNINIIYNNKDRENKIKIQILKNNKKNIYINGVKIKKLSELLGKINIVLFTPEDINILKNGPAYRRKFLDMMIGQIKPNYVYNLNMYLKVLEERNNYLKNKNINNNEELLDIYNKKLSEYAEVIYLYRKEYIEKIKNKINDIHCKITENKEIIKIEYMSDFINKEDFIKQLRNNVNIDKYRGYTTKGIHRDDFNLYINENLINIYGSQGQNRTAVLSLKLCELNIIKEEIGENPILLLDDFMSELDEKRRLNFLKNIDNIQVIITCTDEIKNTNYNIFKVKNGKIIK